jgi:cytoskeletal protein CcmA (bactofilin family)
MSFLKKERAVAADGMVTVIGPEAFLQGVLTAKGSLRIDGKLEGSITDGQTVVVGQGGAVRGDIAAETVVVGGTVTGNITAAAQVEILAAGKVQGDVRTPRLTIEDGAFFDGRCSMNGRGESRG